MRKFILLIALFFTQMATINAIEVEGRVGFFYPQRSDIRKVYGKSGFAEYEIDVSNRLNCFSTCFTNCCENNGCCPEELSAWFNVSYYNKSGHSSCLKNHTRLENWAINVGLSKFFCICDRFHPYFGFGIGAVHASFKDHSEDLHKNNQWGFALLVKSGVQVDITCNLFLDLFVDYASNWIPKRHSHSCISTKCTNTGGLKTGAGIGIRF